MQINDEAGLVYLFVMFVFSSKLLLTLRLSVQFHKLNNKVSKRSYFPNKRCSRRSDDQNIGFFQLTVHVLTKVTFSQ